MTGLGVEPWTSRTSLLHATKSPIGLAHLEIPRRHEALLSLLLAAGHLPGNKVKKKVKYHSGQDFPVRGTPRFGNFMSNGKKLGPLGGEGPDRVPPTFVSAPTLNESSNSPRTLKMQATLNFSVKVKSLKLRE